MQYQLAGMYEGHESMYQLFTGHKVEVVQGGTPQEYLDDFQFMVPLLEPVDKVVDRALDPFGWFR